MKQIFIGGGFFVSLPDDHKAEYFKRLERIIPIGYTLKATDDVERCRVFNPAFRTLTPDEKTAQLAENYLIQNLINKEERQFQRDRLASDPASPDYIDVKDRGAVVELYIKSTHVSINALIMRAMTVPRVDAGSEVDVYDMRNTFIATISVPMSYRRTANQTQK